MTIYDDPRRYRTPDEHHRGPGDPPEMQIVPGPGVSDAGPRDPVSEAEKERVAALVQDRRAIAEADAARVAKDKSERKAEKEREILGANERTAELQEVARAAYLEAGGSPLHWGHIQSKVLSEFRTKHVHRRMAQWCDRHSS